MCLDCAYKIPISVYQIIPFVIWECMSLGVVYSSAVIAHQTWPPDSNLDVMLPPLAPPFYGKPQVWETKLRSIMVLGSF